MKSNTAIQSHLSSSNTDSTTPPAHVEVPSIARSTLSACGSKHQPLPPIVSVIRSEVQSNSPHQSHPSRSIGPEHTKSKSNSIHQSKQSSKSPIKDKVSGNLQFIHIHIVVYMNIIANFSSGFRKGGGGS